MILITAFITTLSIIPAGATRPVGNVWQPEGLYYVSMFITLDSCDPEKPLDPDGYRVVFNFKLENGIRRLYGPEFINNSIGKYNKKEDTYTYAAVVNGVGKYAEVYTESVTGLLVSNSEVIMGIIAIVVRSHKDTGSCMLMWEFYGMKERGL